MWNLTKFSKNIVVIDEYGQKKTYAELDCFTNKLSTLLPSRSFVFSFCENNIGSLFGYVAFLNNKVVPLLLNKDLDMDLVAKLIERYQPTHYWVPKAYRDLFNNDNSEIIIEAYDYILIASNYKSSIMHEELALLLPTSGSTGSPKLVKQSYSNIEENALSIADYLELDETERPITMLPINYSYGLSIINSHIMVGATILMTTKSLLQREFWDFFKRNEATSLAGVPYNYQILKKIKFFKMALPSLRYMTQAGGRLALQLHKDFAEYANENKLKFFVMYGQTEATARMGYLPPLETLNKCGSIGIPIPGGQFYLISDSGKKIEEKNKIGELVYEGPNVTLGYAQKKTDLIIGDERRGVLITGDMAQKDDDGFYSIVGRKKRFIKLFGNRVNLDDAERILQNEFNELECVCSGHDDEMMIFITITDDEMKNRIRSFIAHKLGIHFSAFQVKNILSIPKNESGKVQYRALPIK